MYCIQYVSAETPVDEIHAILERDGCVVVEGVVDHAVVDRVAAELATFFERAEFGTGNFVGFRTKRLGSILRCKCLPRLWWSRVWRRCFGPGARESSSI